MTQPSFTRISELPEQLAIFPLPGALLFPRWQLPLNIFEPRYLNMIDDVIQGDRMIGMVQTVGGTRAKPDIAQTGCAGRITAWSETGDGRYLITLSGIARFDVSKELSVMTPYRQVTPDWTPSRLRACRTASVSSVRCTTIPRHTTWRRTGLQWKKPRSKLW